MSKLIKPVVRVCPICGSTQIAGDIIVTAEQDPYGEWVVKYDHDDVQYEFQNVNSAVRCLNPKCGIPSDPDDLGEITIPLEEYFAAKWAREHHEDMHTTEEYNDAYHAWLETLVYHPYEGTISDFPELGQ